MHRNVTTVAGSTPLDQESSNTKPPKVTIQSRCTELFAPKYWQPHALRAPVLVFTLAVCCSLIAVLEFLLWKSQRDSGLIFAPVINDLPLSDTFLYLYFPTIVAVIFSIYWAWIDLETKRMEPYYQLSKENGALGKDSLLLQYPFSFIPLAPLRAFRDRHWPVFWASLAVVLVTWGLVPTQAGIFSVRTVSRSSNMTFVVSNYSMPFDKQATSLTLRWAQSTYGIAALNETLPRFMTRNYTLAPFEPSNTPDKGFQGQGNYTAPTTMYTLDLSCEDVSRKSDPKFNTSSQIMFFNSTTGCNATIGLDGNLTMSQGAERSSVLAVKEYTGRYVGYHNGGSADYYLSSYCPKTANSTFYAAIQKNKIREEDPPHDVTAIFCFPRYWRQAVSATVDRKTREPLAVIPRGEKEPLPWDVFNATNFEAMLNSGYLGIMVRGDLLPISHFPRYYETIADTNLSLSAYTPGAGPTQPMVGLALATPNQSLERYLDWRALSDAYLDAYRLLFSRAMVDVLGIDAASSNQGVDQQTASEAVGLQRVTSEAVVLEPVFVHIVVGFLAVVSLATIALLFLTLSRKRNLRTDPSTIASVMSIVSDNHMLLSDFADLDCCTEEDVERLLGQKRYKLVNDDASTGIVEVMHSDVHDLENDVGLLGQRRDSPTSIAKPVRPIEFSLWMAFPFVTLFITLAIALGVIYAKARYQGLPIPSSNIIVQSILENYIPTAIATLIEPMWVLINRLLCMLQPLEELQDCNARASKSIDTNYCSLPPQLVIFKALRSKHFVLAAVCAMALLANLLAIAFSGLFNQGLVNVRYSTTFQPPYEFKLVPINGSIGPSEVSTFGSTEASGAYQGGSGEDQFLIAESNFTRNTSLPAWTDNSMFYLPVFDENANTALANLSRFEATTQAMGARLECTELKLGSNFEASMTNNSYATSISMNITVPNGTGDLRCGTKRNAAAGNLISGPLGIEYSCVSGPSANEIVTVLQPLNDATRQVQNACVGMVLFAWMRNAEGTCPLRKKMKLEEEKSLFVLCRPKVVTGSAKIQVDASGRLQRPAEHMSMQDHDGNDTAGLFSNDPINVFGQSNSYLFQWSGGSFHNDSLADDYMNYFIRRSNNTRLIDPNTSVPKFSEVVNPLNQAYSKLFAIWLGRSRKHLFVPVDAERTLSVGGHRVEPEKRLFLSTTMFIIAETILCIYAVVAIWVYARRPGQYLARMPTSIAALIALFAASAAVQDMRGTSNLDKKGRAKHLEQLDSRYGFGSFIGGDGRVHVGIEKVPLVAKPRAKSTSWLAQKLPLLRKRTGGLG